MRGSSGHLRTGHQLSQAPQQNVWHHHRTLPNSNTSSRETNFLMITCVSDTQTDKQADRQAMTQTEGQTERDTERD